MHGNINRYDDIRSADDRLSFRIGNNREVENFKLNDRLQLVIILDEFTQSIVHNVHTVAWICALHILWRVKNENTNHWFPFSQNIYTWYKEKNVNIRYFSLENLITSYMSGTTLTSLSLDQHHKRTQKRYTVDKLANIHNYYYQ